MSFVKQEVVSFAGLNSNVAPELIEDGEARDIYNFRMEKIGKLVSRNGFSIGLYYDICMRMLEPQGIFLPAPICAFGETVAETTKRKLAYFNSQGIIGIGEYILEEKWRAGDTDRMMIYYLRTNFANESFVDNRGIFFGDNQTYRNEQNPIRDQRYYGIFLFSPIEGKFKNKILLGGIDDDLFLTGQYTGYQDFFAIQQVSDKRTASPKREDMINRIFAPNKNVIYEDEWIRQYSDINQYRNKMVISDPINGDMLIEDRFSTDYEPKDLQVNINNNPIITTVKPPHSFVLKPNALETFDVDHVQISLRSKDGEENDSTAGVETGMALYKYTLPKKRQIVSTDYFENKFSNADWLGISETTESGNPITDTVRANLLKAAYVRGHSAYVQADTKFKYFGALAKFRAHGDGATRDFHMNINLFEVTDANTIYTNADNNEEYYDVFGELELNKEEYFDEEGKTVTEIPADVYVWNDMEIPYFPSSGEVQGDGYLTDRSRKFTKKSSNAPRVLELDEIDELAQDAPLGAWRYRFVWDFGDGEYSAPSSELLVPDRLWSAVRDEWIVGSYGRPRAMFDIKDSISEEAVSPFSMQHIQDKLRPPLLIDKDTNQLTEVGKLFYKIKQEIYKETDCKYGIPKDGTIDDISAWDSFDKGNFSTLITADFGDSEIVTKGVIYEGVQIGNINTEYANIYIPYEDFASLRTNASYDLVEFRMAKYEDIYHSEFMNEYDNYYTNGLSYLAIPIFKRGARAYTYNSLFDDEGRYRLAYSNYENPKYQIVFPGVHPNIPSAKPWGTYPAVSSFPINSPTNYATERYVNTLHMPKSAFYETGNVYLNFICQDELGLQDFQNAIQSDYAPSYFNLLRPNTYFRAVKNTRERLINVSNTDVDALSRLIIADAMAELKLIEKENEFGLISLFQYYDKEYGYKDNYEKLNDNTTGLGFASLRVTKGHRPFVGTFSMGSSPLNSETDQDNISALFYDDFYTTEWALPEESWRELDPYSPLTSNGFLNGANLHKQKGIEVYLYGRAERFIGLEQLCSYFPSSLLFGSPRYGIEIKKEFVPEAAKRLLIFRTKSINANEYDPHQYGLVETVDIERLTARKAAELNVKYGYSQEDVNRFKENEAVTFRGDNDNEEYRGVYFFDDIHDNSLDFTNNINQYEGLRKPLWSRFNIAINENVYYGNYFEEDNPMSPRLLGPLNTFVDLDDLGNYVNTVGHTQVESEAGYSVGDNITYKYHYINKAGVRSPEESYFVVVTNTPPSTTGFYAIVLNLFPSTYDSSIEKVKVYRKLSNTISTEDRYYYVGELDRKSSGILVDKNKPKMEEFQTWYPNIQRYNSGVRWSERYRPDWIKGENMAEYRSGDGKHITGLESLDGNLVVFKETSIHRVAVQAANPPISRTDEVSPEVGCIAPNTLINVDNTLYFLSWKGWMKYDNNMPQKIDIKFDEELQWYIAMLGDSVRDATSGYNPANNEIYLNLPSLPEDETILRKNLEQYLSDNYLLNNIFTNSNFFNIDYDNVDETYRIFDREDWFYQVKRRLMGHIYVLNLTTGFAYKFGYPPTLVSQRDYGVNPMRKMTFFKKDDSSLNNVRMYYTNSLGEMRSADIVPSSYGVFYLNNQKQTTLSHAGIYIETPYKDNDLRYLDTDELINAYYYYDKDVNSLNELFPNPYNFGIRSSFKSKIFTGNDETMIKRIRNVLLNLYSRGYIRVVTYSNNYDASDDRIRIHNLLRPGQYLEDRTGKNWYLFNPTDTKVTGNYGEIIANPQIQGRFTNIIECIPQSRYDDDLLDPLSDIFDLDGKPIRFSIEIFTEYRTQLNELSFYWRPIHTYLG